MSDPDSLQKPPYIILILGVISIFAAAAFMYTGKVWVRLSGWVYRTEKPKWFWWEVMLYLLVGICFVGCFLYEVYGF